MHGAIYSRPAVYDALYDGPIYEAQVEFVLDRLVERNVEATSALVVGCGTGGHSPHLREAGFDVLGIDPEPEMLARAREKSDAEFLTGSLPDLGIDGEFDLVWAPFDVLQYLDREQLGASLESLGDVLAEDGLLVFDAGRPPVEGSPIFRIAEHEGEGYGQLVNCIETAAGRYRLDTMIFTEEEWFFDRHDLLVISDGELIELLEALGLTVQTYDGYDGATRYDSTVFVASR